MAQLNRVQAARQEGMDYAYQLVKRGGIEDLERRVLRGRRGFSPPFINEGELHKFETQVKENCIRTFLCVTAMILHDKYGFGQTRITRFSKQFHEMADSIAGEWLTFDDIIGVIKEETGVDLTEYTLVSERKLEEMDKTLGKRRAKG